MPPVLRAHIDAGRRRQPLLPEYLVKLARIIVREKHIVPVERKAFGAARHHQHQPRQRALRRFHPGHRSRRCGAEASIGQRRDIAIGQNIARLDHLAAGQNHPRGAAAVNANPLDMGAISKHRPMPRRQRRHSFRQLVHPAFDKPDTARFQMRDQHQRRRRLIGRGAAIGGVAAIELVQPGVAEMLAQRLPHRLKRIDRQHLGQAGQPEARRQPDRRSCRRRHEACLQRVPDSLGFRLKSVPAPRFGRARKVRHRFARPRRIAPQVEPRAVPPAVPGQQLAVHQPRMIIQIFTQRRKQRLKHRLGGKHRRPGIHGHAATVHGAQLASGMCHPLDHRHRHARARQPGSRT